MVKIMNRRTSESINAQDLKTLVVSLKHLIELYIVIQIIFALLFYVVFIWE